MPVGIMGRSVTTAGKHNQSMKKALDDHADGVLPLARASVEGIGEGGAEGRGASTARKSVAAVANVGTAKGDPLEVVEVVNKGMDKDNHDEDQLNSFLPTSLKCLNKFLPSITLAKGPKHEELLGVAGNAPTMAQNVVSELARMHTEGPDGIHFLAFLGGALLICGAVMNIVYGVLKLSPLHTFFSLMMFVFGTVTLVIEQQRAVFPPFMRAYIEQYFLFLTLITGRGAFYIYVGAIQAATNWKSSSFNTLVGLFVLFVGGVYVHTGFSVSAKLHQLQHSLQSPEVITHAFKKADADNSGALDVKELVTLMSILGSTMTEKEADTCLIMLDKDGSGTIDLNEFLLFMERSESSRVF